VSSPSWVPLADLFPDQINRILTVRPRRRTYINQADAGYDWAAGHEFVVTAESSPLYRNIVAVDEVRGLKACGYTHIHIHYNTGTDAAPLEIKL